VQRSVFYQVVGAGLDPTSQIGPLINAYQAEWVIGYV
jgi:acyl-CoA reductase-like NAD-dependent aldehyde dehydrogenase